MEAVKQSIRQAEEAHKVWVDEMVETKKPVDEVVKLFSGDFPINRADLLGLGQYPPLPEIRHCLCLALSKCNMKNKDIQKMTGWEQSRISKSLMIARKRNFEPEFNVKTQKLIELIK